jgi:integrase
LPPTCSPDAPPEQAVTLESKQPRTATTSTSSPDDEARVVLSALDALALKLDGKTAEASTINRKRAVFYGVLDYAVQLGDLDSNPLHKVKWTPPKTSETVDPRVVINPAQAASLLVAVTYVGQRGRGKHLMAFFACMYYAAMRPAEVIALRRMDCTLPSAGWGSITLAKSRPRSTGSGQTPATLTRSAGSSTAAPGTSA